MYDAHAERFDSRDAATVREVEQLQVALAIEKRRNELLVAELRRIAGIYNSLVLSLAQLRQL